MHSLRQSAGSTPSSFKSHPSTLFDPACTCRVAGASPVFFGGSVRCFFSYLRGAATPLLPLLLPPSSAQTPCPQFPLLGSKLVAVARCNLGPTAASSEVPSISPFWICSLDLVCWAAILLFRVKRFTSASGVCVQYNNNSSA